VWVALPPPALHFYEAISLVLMVLVWRKYGGLLKLLGTSGQLGKLLMTLMRQFVQARDHLHLGCHLGIVELWSGMPSQRQVQV
jgi:hypothetical protein